MFLKIKCQRLKLVLLLTKQQTKDPCEMGVTTDCACYCSVHGAKISYFPDIAKSKAPIRYFIYKVFQTF